MVNPVEKEVFSTVEAADYLGITAATLRAWHRLGKINLPKVRMGRLVKYLKADLDAFIQSKRETSSKRHTANKTKGTTKAVVG